MSKVNEKIRDNYLLYLELVKKRKVIQISPIYVKKIKPNFRKSRLGESPVSHVNLSESLKLEIEIGIANNKDFKFKLFCDAHFERPIFRYDATGPAHRNADQGLPLKDQQITTPHFHCFNKSGIEIAFKTEALSDENQLRNLEDVNVCVMHFCEEGNMRYSKNDFPEVIFNQGELGLTFNEEDPLKNVRF